MTTRRLHAAFAVCLSAFFAGGIAAGEKTADVDFVRDWEQLERVGSRDALALRDGALVYDTRAGSAEKRRTATVRFPRKLGGDFRIEADFRIQRFDHWNQLRFGAVAADTGDADAFSVMLVRRQKKAGAHELALVLREGDRREELAVPDKTMRGTLALARVGREIVYSFRPVSDAGPGEWKELGRWTAAGAPPVRAFLGFETPPATHAAVTVGAARFAWEHDPIDPANAFAPTFAPSRVVAQVADGSLALVHLENVRVDDGGYLVEPGGRAVFMAKGGLNQRGGMFTLRAQGRMRLDVISPGSAETLELSETLALDETATSETAELRERRFGLDGGFLLRNFAQRRWRPEQWTHNNFFVFTLSPAGDEPLYFIDPALHARILEPLRPFAPAVSAPPARLADDGDFRTVAWTPPPVATGFLEGAESPLASGERRIVHGVPFVACPTRLHPGAPSLEIPLGATAGAIHLLHVAGKQPAEPPSGIGATAATYMIVYDDGATDAIFAELRWNCGVYANGHLPASTPGQPRPTAQNTWWGPPGFSQARALHLPKPPAGVHWNTLYHARYLVPRPDKKIAKLLVFQRPGDAREFALLGISLARPGRARLALVEPDEAVFPVGRPLDANVMVCAALPAADGERTVQLAFAKSDDVRVPAGELRLTTRGRFSFGRARVMPPSGGLSYGPVRLVADGADAAGLAKSSPLGLLPAPRADDKPFSYTMICGGADPQGDFERMRRLGYDRAKVHIGWKTGDDGKPDFAGWPERFARIGRAGLTVDLRNMFTVPPYWSGRVSWSRIYLPGEAELRDETGKRNGQDAADPVYRQAVTEYYREVARLANAAPNVVGINANYGVAAGLGLKQLKAGDHLLAAFRRDLAARHTLAEVNKRTGAKFASFDDIGRAEIYNDNSRLLLPVLTETLERETGATQRSVVEAIRETGNRSLLIFNVNFHPVENKLQGYPFAEYLRLGRDFPPASLFHETSDRYCLSFAKWLAAGRTLGQPFGDEGNQTPPTYEHNILAYLWMAMMQCSEANYCQWWGGKPAHQNVAWLKPYHHLLMNAEYLPDPVALALTLHAGHAEAPDIVRNAFHSRTTSHYALANTLRAANVNADRYLIDEFPELDGAVKARLLVDDNSRALSPDFADRLETFMRAGGTFLASFETDRLNDHAFFKRFGATVADGALAGAGVRTTPGLRDVYELSVGAGRLAVLGGRWQGGWEPVFPGERREFFRDLFSRLGGFKPLVDSSEPGVFATPYRDRDGDLLVFLINITCEPKDTEVTVAVPPAGAAAGALDHGTGVMLTATALSGGGVRVQARVDALGGTLLRFPAARPVP